MRPRAVEIRPAVGEPRRRRGTQRLGVGGRHGRCLNGRRSRCLAAVAGDEGRQRRRHSEPRVQPRVHRPESW